MQRRNGMTTPKRSAQEARRLIGGQRLLDGSDVDEIVNALNAARSTVLNRLCEDKRKLRRYKKRYRVERTHSWLNNFRRAATRWARSLAAYKGFVHIAYICITLMKF